MFIESLELPIDRAVELPSERLPLNDLLNDPVIDFLSMGLLNGGFPIILIKPGRWIK